MSRQKNCRTCSIQNCNNQTNRFRQFTLLALEKSQKKGTYDLYSYLEPGQQLCHIHYMNIVESDCNQKLETPLSNKENIINSK